MWRRASAASKVLSKHTRSCPDISTGAGAERTESCQSAAHAPEGGLLHQPHYNTEIPLGLKVDQA